MTKAALEFEPEDANQLLRALSHNHAPDSRVAIGERLAAVVLSKSKKQLKEILRRMDAESGPTLFELLEETEKVLEARHGLVKSAEERLLYSGHEVLQELTGKKMRWQPVKKP